VIIRFELPEYIENFLGHFSQDASECNGRVRTRETGIDVWFQKWKNDCYLPRGWVCILRKDCIEE